MDSVHFFWPDAAITQRAYRMNDEFDRRPLGAIPTDDGFRFRVWAPNAEQVELMLASTGEREPLENVGAGYFEHTADDLLPATAYKYIVDHGDPMPDPASRFQPEGVHGPSSLIDPTSYEWKTTSWSGLPQQDLIFYELHVGTFTSEGLFRSARSKLDYLVDLGITAIELMPVADFPGRWNWGYDPAAFYAPSRAYGNPDELRALVDAAHDKGIAVFLDVIYNHLGPDGAYAAAYAPFFTDKHETPWGQAINLDDRHSEGIRHFFIDNALHWLREYRMDGLRLDATFALVDDSPTHFLSELSDAVAGLSESTFKRYLIAEDHRNERRLLDSREAGGHGLDGVWVDDFHHIIRNHSAGDSTGYYVDFRDSTAEDIAETIRQGWYFTGQPSAHFDEHRGTDPSGLDPESFVFYIQNHDQVGNRPHGDRITDSIDLSLYRAITAIVLFAPQLPMLFMGQEWAASTPFQYFTDHNEELGKLVQEGRKEEFGAFEGFDGEVPDPQDPATFQRSKLKWDEADQSPHENIYWLYRDLLSYRKQLTGSNANVETHGEHALIISRGSFHLLAATADDQQLPVPEDSTIVLDTESETYALDGKTVIIKDNTVHFQAPGAILMSSAPA